MLASVAILASCSDQLDRLSQADPQSSLVCPKSYGCLATYPIGQNKMQIDMISIRLLQTAYFHTADTCK